MEFAGNRQAYAFILVCLFAVEISFSGNSTLDSNHLAWSPCKNDVFVFRLHKSGLVKRHFG